MAVLHFPTTNQKHMCLVDGLASHEGHEAVDPKFILQQFIWSEPLETVAKKFTHSTVVGEKRFHATLFGAPAEN
eukprot:1524797-Prymnesium_polylepis.1